MQYRLDHLTETITCIMAVLTITITITFTFIMTSVTISNTITVTFIMTVIIIITITITITFIMTIILPRLKKQMGACRRDQIASQLFRSKSLVTMRPPSLVLLCLFCRYLLLFVGFLRPSPFLPRPPGRRHQIARQLA